MFFNPTRDRSGIGLVPVARHPELRVGPLLDHPRLGAKEPPHVFLRMQARHEQRRGPLGPGRDVRHSRLALPRRRDDVRPPVEIERQPPGFVALGLRRNVYFTSCADA
jgi:hypothetical protein